MTAISRHTIIPVLAAALWLCLCAAIFAAGPTASAQVNPRLVRVGTTFQLTVTVKAEGNYQIQPFQLPTPGGLTIVNPAAATQQSLQILNGVTTSTSSYIAVYRADKPGIYTLGPINVPVSLEGGASSTITAAPVTVEAYDDAPRPASDIIHAAASQWWKYLLALAILAILATAVAWWLKERKAKPSAAPLVHLPAMKSLEQATLDEIRALPRPHESDLEAVKAYFDKVDHILRAWLAKKYSLSTSDSTTWEINQQISQRKNLDPRARGILVILNDCDWVKYAKARPSQVDIDRVPARVADVLSGASAAEARRSDTGTN